MSGTRKRTERTLEEMAKLAASGLHASEAANKLGIKRSYLYALAKRAGIQFEPAPRGPLKKTHDDRADDMARRYRAGETLQQIGQSYGMSRERVRQLLYKYHGITSEHSGRLKASERKKAERAARRDQRSLLQWGCTWAEYKWLVALGQEMMTAGLGRARTPTGAFNQQRNNARQRGIRWELTLWQWWTIWQESGRWNDRGRGHGYVMARFGDVGPYAADNVEIIPAALNTSLANNKGGLPIGVSQPRRGGGYLAQRSEGGKLVRLGTFPTPELAHAAYLAAGGV